MSLKTFIQEKVLLPRKWKQYRRNRPQPQFIGLHKAKKVGIIADFRETSLIRIVADFHKKIRNDGMTICLAALVPDQRNSFNQFEYEKQFPGSLVYLIATDEINRWGQVNKLTIKPFLDQEYDIIFFLDRTPVFTLYDIILSATSKMVAGRIGENREIVDFGIEIDITSPLENLTENLYKYLTSIGVQKHESQKTADDLKLF